jgi:hypothetical protein
MFLHLYSPQQKLSMVSCQFWLQHDQEGLLSVSKEKKAKIRKEHASFALQYQKVLRS